MMHRSLLTTVAVLSFFLSSIAIGQTIDSDTTLDETSTITRPKVRDGLTPPTVVTVDGAILRSADTFDTSILNVIAGEIKQPLSTYVVAGWDNSTINMIGGRIHGVTDYAVLPVHNSTLNMEGGTISGDRGLSTVRAQDQTNVNISGGLIGGKELGVALLFRGDHLSISGGQIGPLDGVDVWGGTPIIVRGDGTAEITGGVRASIGMSSTLVKVGENATVDIRGGENRVTPRTIFRPGLLELVHATGASTVNLYGGKTVLEPLPGEQPPIPALVAEDTATINVFGTDLVLEDNLLTGILADGTPVEYQTVGNIVIHEIPEPSTGLLLLAGILGTLATVRRRQRPASECRRRGSCIAA